MYSIVLQNIVYYLGGIINSFASAVLLQSIISIFNDKRYNHKTWLISWFLFIPSGIIAQIIQDNFQSLLWVRSILFFITIFLITTLYYKTNWLKSFLITFIISTILIITDALMALFAIAFDLDISNILNNKYIYFPFIFAISLLQIFIGKVINFFFFEKKYIEAKILEVNAKYIIPPFLALIICLLLSLSTLAFNKYNYSIYFITINIVQLFVVSYIGIYNLTRAIKHKESEQEFENTKLYNKSLLVINEQVKGIKHDMGNIIQAINGYLVLKDYDGATKYCNNILDDFSNVNLLSILSPNIIDEPAIYSIIAKKKYIAEEKGVKLTISVTASCKNICFPLLELTRCIGILLDNALEATIETEEKKFWIDIRYEHKSKRHVITIGNSVKDPDKVDVTRMFEHGYSTKKIPSGIGLYEIVRFMDKYNKGHINPLVNRENNTFTQELIFEFEEDCKMKKSS